MVAAVTPEQASPHSNPCASEAPLFHGVALSFASKSRKIRFWNSRLVNAGVVLIKYPDNLLFYRSVVRKERVKEYRIGGIVEYDCAQIFPKKDLLMIKQICILPFATVY